MKLTIAGHGFVGKAHEALFKKTNEITTYDPPKGMNEFGNPDGVVVCVGTPQGDDGSCYMGHVFEVMKLVDVSIPVLIKSTISLEGWYQLIKQYPDHKITFSPEFLREVSAIEDVLNADSVLLGGGDENIWVDVFKGCMSSGKVAIFNPEELILAKYFRNSFLSTKVAFFNQVYDFCEKIGVNFDEVREAISMDKRIGPGHTLVPGPDGQRGFGGHCFPKDTSAIVKTADGLEIDLSIIKEVRKYNETIRNG